MHMYHEEGCFTLQSNRAGLDVSEIIHEFQLAGQEIDRPTHDGRDDR